LNPIQFETAQAARQASEAPRPGFFSGVPIYIKDNTDIAGLPTTQGSQATHAPAAKKTGAFAKQLLAQGFVVHGKSRLPEFGFNASTEFDGLPPSRNPWNPEYSCGASSGGSAALVASGVVPIAHANDGGGSIRIPAAACGLVGLKPTRGRLVDAEAIRVLPINIVGEGVVTRSVRDTANFFTEAERYYQNRALPMIGKVDGPSKKRLRIGLVLDSITGHATDAETRQAVLDTANRLEKLGHTVSEMPLPVPATFEDDFSIYWGMLSFMIGKLGRLQNPKFNFDETENLTKGLYDLYRKNILKTPFVLYRLKKTYQLYAQVFRNYDVILSPVLAHTTPKIGWLSPTESFETHFDRLTQYVSFTPLNNAAGGPAISLPLGSTKSGLPIGIHFSANHGAERTLLELAFELEADQPFKRIQDF
jgi:amidase